MATLAGVTAGDSFNRANGSLGTSDTGHTWTVNSGTATITSNAAQATSTAVATISSLTADGAVQLRVSTASSTCRVRFRWADSSNYWEWGNNTAASRLTKVVAGTSTTLFEATEGIAVGDVFAAVFSGSTITIYKNGVRKSTITDSANSSNTAHGFQIGTNAAIDDWYFWSTTGMSPTATVTANAPAGVPGRNAAAGTTTGTSTANSATVTTFVPGQSFPGSSSASATSNSARNSIGVRAAVIGGG